MQQMAGMLVEAPRSAPSPKFSINVKTSGRCELRLHIDTYGWTLSATRSPGIARQFANVEPALRVAQQIALAAGMRDDHEWTGRPDDLPAMPAVELYLVVDA